MDWSYKRRSLLRRIAALSLTAGVDQISPTNDRVERSELNNQNPDSVFARSGTLGDAMFLDIPSFPIDAFIIPVYGAPYLVPEWAQEFDEEDGWNLPTESEKLRTLLQLHPDVFAPRGISHIRPGQDHVAFEHVDEEALEIAFRTGVGTDEMRRPNFKGPASEEDHEERYGYLRRKHSWEYPNGNPVENPIGLADRTFDDEARRSFGALPSIFAPGTLDITRAELDSLFEQGASAVYIDGILQPVEELDFSVWATDSFRSYLSSLSTDRQDELGISDPESFSIKEYIKGEGLEPQPQADDKPNPAVDPVFREFVLHTHRQYRDFIETYRNHIHAKFPDRAEEASVQLYGNQNFGDGISGDPVSTIYVSDHMDVVSFEDSGGTLPPEFVRDFAYKIGDAAGRFEKPVWVEGRMNEASGSLRGLDPEQRYPMLMRMKLAEAYANGALRMVGLTHGDSVKTSLNHWIRSDGTISEKLQSFINFVWTHERFLNPTTTIPANDVAVVLSLPTLLWRYRPQWGLGRPNHPTDHAKSLRGTVKLLRESQFTYDILIFGHPELWTDSNQLAMLSDYEAVILPRIECISDNQLDALESVFAEQGLVVTSGPAPERTEMFEPLPTPDLFNNEEVVVLDSDPGLTRITDGATDSELTRTLLNRGVQSSAPDADSTLGVNHLYQERDSRHLVHLVNYDYDPSADSFGKKSSIEIQLRGIGDEFDTARFYSPQLVTDISVTVANGSHELEVPELGEWGFVVLVESAANFTTGSKKVARKRTETASRLVEEAKVAGQDWPIEAFTTANVRREEAQLALVNNAYSQAQDAAEAAISAIGHTKTTPVIGIDHAHGQPESIADRHGADPYGPLQDRFPDYEYRIVTDWSSNLFEEIDALIIPPAFRFKEAEFGYSSDELNRIERFVEDGGHLAVMARGGVAEDIDQLTTRFGIKLRKDPIVAPEDSWFEPPVEVPNNHILTSALERFSGDLAASIKEVPPYATILGKTREDSDAWIHKGGELKTREENEPSAAGLPIYAIQRHGSGLVVTIGKAYHYLIEQPRASQMEHRLTENLLRVLGDTGPPKIGRSNVAPPRDLDEDGRFEDVNGDFDFDIQDLQSLFVHRDSEVVADNAPFFRFQ